MRRNSAWNPKKVEFLATCLAYQWARGFRTARHFIGDDDGLPPATDRHNHKPRPLPIRSDHHLIDSYY